MVTHELKTPLTPIKGYCEMLRDFSFGTLTKEQIHYVEKIHSSAMVLERLIGDVLDVQKIDMGKMSFEIKSFDVGNFLDGLQQDSSHLMKNRGIEFVTTNSVKTTLKTDQFRLQQVLENMIRNSVDFVPPKTGKIEVGVKQENGKMIFHVKDNGIGIPKEKQQNIFKKFYQVDTSHTRKHGGTGLGLTICKGIVNDLGGKIWFESQTGKGTTFSFDIPLENN
jgi:signal transduction histidine kinase